MWQKLLIKDSIFQQLILKEVWGWVSAPQLRSVPDGRRIKFFVINCQHPGEPAPMGLAEHDIVWLLRGQEDLREEEPAMILAHEWLSPSWPGL